MIQKEAANVIPLTFLRSPQRGILELVLTHPDGATEVRRVGRQKALEMMEHLVRYLRDCE